MSNLVCKQLPEIATSYTQENISNEMQKLKSLFLDIFLLRNECVSTSDDKVRVDPIGGSKGDPNYFIFMQFSAKKFAK